VATIRNDIAEQAAAVPNSPATPPEVQRQRPKWQRLAIDALYPTVALILALVAWALWIELGSVKDYIIPGPVAVWTEMVDNFSFLWDQAQVTLLETAIGFVIAVAAGIAFAILIATVRIVEKSVYPLLVASQVIPKVALAPILLIQFGFGIASKVVVVILIAFFPVVVNGVIGLQSLEQEKMYLARSMGASGWSTFWRIRFPQSLPSLFGGIKLAAIFAIVGAVVGEFIGAREGLGRTLLQAQSQFNTELMFAAIGYLTIVGILFYASVDVIERLTIPWHISKRRGSISS
jgi:NitT/TauT family transport system permease protein